MSLSNEDDDTDNDLERVLFMTVEDDECFEYFEEEGELDLREELISTVEELGK
jgi:hypothetical protein